MRVLQKAKDRDFIILNLSDPQLSNQEFLIHKTRNKAPAIRIAWLLTGILTGLILLVGFTLLLLWNSKINGIPLSVIARILSDLASRL